MNQSSNGAIVAVVIIILVAVVGFLAYKQGYFKGQTQDDNANGLEIKVGGNGSSQQ
jgi:hypothetical protein